MTKEEYLKKMICRCCGKPLNCTTLNRKYHLECCEEMVRKRLINRKAVLEGATAITCVRCGQTYKVDVTEKTKDGKKIYFIKGDVGHFCPKCVKEIQAIEAAHKKVMEGLRKESTSQPVCDRDLPPYLRGKTAAQRQQIAYEQFMRREREQAAFHRRYEPAVNMDRVNLFSDTVPRFKPKPKPIPKETAPISYHTRRDPETGQMFDVECRGTGFYGGQHSYEKDNPETLYLFRVSGHPISITTREPGTKGSTWNRFILFSSLSCQVM